MLTTRVRKKFAVRRWNLGGFVSTLLLKQFSDLIFGSVVLWSFFLIDQIKCRKWCRGSFCRIKSRWNGPVTKHPEIGYQTMEPASECARGWGTFYMILTFGRSV